MNHVLPELPYPKNALEPLMSAETLEYHHGKHHAGYVKKLNQLIPGTDFERLSLEEIIAAASGPIFNNAAQVWNHNFFWHCLTPERTAPSGQLRDALERDFGGVDRFLGGFRKKGIGLFGSGYVWLAKDERSGRLTLEAMQNARNPLVDGKKAILACDVWEHAYYIDYRNDRSRFLDGFMRMINWDFAATNYETAWEMAA